LVEVLRHTPPDVRAQFQHQIDLFDQEERILQRRARDIQAQREAGLDDPAVRREREIRGARIYEERRHKQEAAGEPENAEEEQQDGSQQ
jgi:hypothetical protein